MICTKGGLPEKQTLINAGHP